MSSFTTRVELHDATYGDYMKLHEAMRKKGFSQLITSDSGNMYHLPTAEYDISGNFNRSEILDLAKESIKLSGRSGAVLVTETSGRTWSGLEKVV